MRVISLGGSLVAPTTGVGVQFLKNFRDLILTWLEEDHKRKVILIVGGGAPARIYQRVVKELVPTVSSINLDWVGVAATHLNAELVKSLFGCDVLYPVVKNPYKAVFKKGRVLVAGGWKPGFSTDYDAVVLAKRFKVGRVINLSNVDGIYTSDPLKDSQAIPIRRMMWKDLKELVGNHWEPGLNLPFDPIATAAAEREGLELVVASGMDLENLDSVLRGFDFKGTEVF